LHKAEDGGIGANAKSQGDNGDRRATAIAKQSADGVAKVL